MREKTGNLEKLKYDFNTGGHMESYIPNLNDWFRQTAREFRSSSYKRRIDGVEYIGPVYEYNTNREVKVNIPKDCIVSLNYTPSIRPFGN